MNQRFQGWPEVARRLRRFADDPRRLGQTFRSEDMALNQGQRASLRAVAERIQNNGLVIADEVGMGKTRIAAALTRAVTEAGGRVAILLPPGLGYQWRDELRECEVDAPHLLRTMWGFFEEWYSGDSREPKGWFGKPVVLISHLFSNWRLGENSPAWRSTLLLALYAQWRKDAGGRLPRGYYQHLDHEDWSLNLVTQAAHSIYESIPDYPDHPACQLIDSICGCFPEPWTRALDAACYQNGGELRGQLEQAVGLGLGVFDLVIIDEAHKARGEETGLSRLIDHMVLLSRDYRRLSMTATPIELNVDQWNQTLERIGLGEEALTPIKGTIDKYHQAVSRVRKTPSDNEAREQYRRASQDFHTALSPYLIRRDKREESSIQRFAEVSKMEMHAYRRETEIKVEAAELDGDWRQAVFAAEALSVASRQGEDSLAKRMRLSFGNGHGIACLVEQTLQQEEEDSLLADQNDEEIAIHEHSLSAPLDKRLQRVEWWLEILKRPLFEKEQVLFNHPAIMAAVNTVEDLTSQGEKVLVFGRFIRPLRALTDLINARQMLRNLKDGKPWPQSKVFAGTGPDASGSDWPATLAAINQLGLQSEIKADSIDHKLQIQYQELENARERFARNLIARIEEDFHGSGQLKHSAFSLFTAFKNSVESGATKNLALVASAMRDLLGEQDIEDQSIRYARLFGQLVDALMDKDDADKDSDGNIDEDEAIEYWPVLENRLSEEYNRQRGQFARLMYGGTPHATKRMLQLAFNRRHGNPRVLISQSQVGREGLNLHKACCNVVLLHPEWNPGVVEQQIGRIDRVGSHWERLLEKAIEEGSLKDYLPRIEFRPVIFGGTYDEYNWAVLRERWEDLQAQLHGIVIPERIAKSGQISKHVVSEINGNAPSFTPK